MRSDNGPPFAPLAVHGLSSLAAGWIQLGICPERIEPRHPEQNGRHERMHKTLKQQTASRPERTIGGPGIRFTSWAGWTSGKGACCPRRSRPATAVRPGQSPATGWSSSFDAAPFTLPLAVVAVVAAAAPAWPLAAVVVAERTLRGLLLSASVSRLVP